MIESRGIWLPEDDTHFRDLLLDSPLVDGKGTYQITKLHMALRFVTNWTRAVDIGAHVGLWSYHLAKSFIHVEAFEPVPEHANCFVKNVEAENVTLHQCALGAEEGRVAITRCVENSGHSHVAPDGDVTARILTLDSFGLQHVGFVKLDVEGFERDVLRGAIDTLARCRPTIIVEQKPGNGARYGHGDHGALRFLEKLGAKIVAQKAGDYVLVW